MTAIKPDKPIAAIVLAAGQSLRMGKDNKLLLPVVDKSTSEQSMVQSVVSRVLAANFEQVIVVLGFESDKLRSHLLDDRLTFSENLDYQTGMASSLRCGLQALNDDIEGAMIVLADMPLMTTVYLNQLIKAFYLSQTQSIVAPYREGRRGNPVIWHRSYFDEMKQQQGDQGAKTMLHKYAGHVVAIEINSEAIFVDIDTPADLKLM